MQNNESVFATERPHSEMQPAVRFCVPGMHYFIPKTPRHFSYENLNVRQTPQFSHQVLQTEPLVPHCCYMLRNAFLCLLYASPKAGPYPIPMTGILIL